jgi:uncharacterized protein with GYD domain
MISPTSPWNWPICGTDHLINRAAATVRRGVRCVATTNEGGDMPKFMIKASYNPEGAKGLMKEGGTARRAAVQKLVESLGGKVEAFYFAYGENDAYIITDMPDAATGIAISLTVNASGAVRLSTIPLITPEELDAASKKTVSYRAPGA